MSVLEHIEFELIHRSPTSTGSSVYSTPVGGITPATTPQTEGGKGGQLENCFVYKKEDAADELFAGTAKKNRKNSKSDRRNSKAWNYRIVPSGRIVGSGRVAFDL